MARCPRCDGFGRSTCTYCGGRGSWLENKLKLNLFTNTMDYAMEYTLCSMCGGTKNITCSHCGGQGEVEGEDTAESEPARAETTTQPATYVKTVKPVTGVVEPQERTASDTPSTTISVSQAEKDDGNTAQHTSLPLAAGEIEPEAEHEVRWMTPTPTPYTPGETRDSSEGLPTWVKVVGGIAAVGLAAWLSRKASENEQASAPEERTER